MADTGPTTLSLFSGIGGLDIGWCAATGGRVVGYAERDAYAAATLLARMEDEALEPAPVWCGDIIDLPLAPFHGVDAICGGFPCQDISMAGRGAGIEGERSGLWGRAFVPAIRTLRPRLVFLENVSGLLTRGLDVVLWDLAALGYDARWTSLRASDVGAPHRRERVFILAHAHQSGREGERGSGLLDSQRTPQRDDAHRRNGEGMGDDAGTGLEWASAAGYREGQPAPGRPIFPPGPDSSRWPAILAERPWLAPAVEPGVCRMADGISRGLDEGRVDRLRALGNSVVPLQAAYAARLLYTGVSQ